ncbi:MAG: hypothetical protein AAF430_24630, partial [Myxococcota bacterium]
MTATRWTWLVLVTIWFAFFGWYTSFDGPLRDDEIEAYLRAAEKLEPPDPVLVETMRRFMEEDTGDDFIMLNIGKAYDEPLLVEDVEPGQSTEEVLAHYLDYVAPALISRASHPVQFGLAAGGTMDLLNAGDLREWGDTVSIRYRSRRDFMDFATNPRMSQVHVFKVAAIERAIAFPADPWFHFGDLRIILGLVLGLLGCAVSWRISSRRVRRAE